MDLQDKSLGLTKYRIEAMHKLGLYDTDDVLSYYPFRYEYTQTSDFSEWKEKDKVFFEAEIVKPARVWRHGRQSSAVFEAAAFDRVFKVTIYNRPWVSGLELNTVVTISGIYNGKNRITAISYDTVPLKDHPAVVPVYSLKAGIKQKTVRACIEKVYQACVNQIIDEVPRCFIDRYRLLHKADALYRIHFPESKNDVREAVRSLKYEEFLRFFTAISLLHMQDEGGVYKQPKMIDTQTLRQVIRGLPYRLTEGQKKALDDVLRDMSSSRPMYRLVQGDVGCGKTAVAALAICAAVKAGYQAALLAPTEILARQHMQSLQDILKGTGITCEVLYSGLSAAEKKRILESLASGETDVIAGTHALLQDDVVFRNLGFVTADEQQRFGVEQRRKLREKGAQTDFLLMSATPIPRTLASTMFGDMDISTIETMPSGRKKPVTKFINENSFRTVLPEVMDLLHKGHQLYVICAAVEANEDYKARNVYETAETLQKLFAPYRVGLLHGRMSSQEKNDVMKAFYENEVQILVSTTVVEVGMNVVNATGMIIYDAERFGLSQLHQLRGRVQRGSDTGYCWLLSGSRDESVRDRLNVLVKSNDGFEISYEDLRLRGPGDILGTRQSGVPDFILGDVTQDHAIIDTAKKDAARMIAESDDPQFAAMIASVRWHMENSSSYRD
ncbi:MAG: ATP-dependent DNA helicase RecG [Solobacterium sp.]|nr:ATP-dependent DNA helicase RecG [Solobacterium sp.]